MDASELTAELSWVRALARALVGEGEADDIAQDAWLVANDRAPTDGRPVRPWLARVTRNLVRMRARSAARRRSRELAAPLGDAVPTAEELVERVELHRILAEEVLALREPYRSTLVLRYVEGLASAEIARRLGIQSATVRQRLKTALEQLRDRLRAREAPRRSWLAALAPLALPRATVGGLAMKKSAAIAIAILVLLLGGAALWRRARSGETVDETPSAVATGPASSAVAGDASARTNRLVVLPAWLAQPGVAGRRIAGRVVANGQPVPDATVRLAVNLTSPRLHLPAMTAGPPFLAVARIATDASGAFDFGAMPAANYVVSAEAPRRAPISVSVAAADPRAAPPPDRLVLRLGDCRARLYGTVRDSANGIARARITVAGRAGVDADERGAYELCIPDAPYPNLRVEADGYGTISVEIPALFGDLRRDFTLVPEATIAGTVVDPMGQPVALAAVEARPILSEGWHEVAVVSAVADAAGRFQLSGLAPAKYELGAVAGRLASDDTSTVVATAGGTRDVTVVVQPRVRVSGRVTMRGEPVAGVQVGIERDAAVADTQLDGTFVLEGIRAGTHPIRVAHRVVRAPAAVTVGRDDVANLAIEIDAMASLHGRITRHGVAVAGATIEYPRDRSLTAFSDESGTYVLDDLPDGAGIVYAHDPKAFTNKQVTLAAGESRALDLELDGGGEVRGTVVDESGTPVRGVYVRLESLDGEDSCGSATDATGAFECATLAGHLDYAPAVFPTVAQTVAFSPASGEKFPAIHVADGDATVTGVRLAIADKRLAIRGTVLDDSGAPVPDAHVSIVGTNQWGDPAKGRADADGAFVLDELAPGHYQLRAHAPDGSDGVAAGIAAGTTGVTIRLVRPGRVEGTLVGFATTPRLFARELLDRGELHGAAIAGDRFTFTLPPGSYAISAIVDRLQVDGAGVDVTSGAVAHVALRARGAARVEGRILEFGTGAPVTQLFECRASVSVGGTSGPVVGSVGQATDPGGRVALDAPVGRARITCAPAGTYSLAGAELDVAAGAPNRVDLVAVKLVAPPSDPGFQVAPWTIPATVVASAQPGLSANDQIVAVDGAPVAALLPGAVVALVANHRPGTVATLSLVRAGAPTTVRVTVR